jgi:hypothetical protein
MPARERTGLSLKSAAFNRARHVCAFFGSPEEQYEVLTPFMQEGLQAGEKAFYIVDPQLHANHRARLAASGVAVEEAEGVGQLEICGWGDAYLRGDRFDQNAMLALIEEVLTRGSEQGYPLTRLVANMEWALEDCPGVNDILEYETRLNYVLPNYDDPVICTYDLTRFDASLVMDMLRTHPTVIVGGVIQSNPFFVPPDELLRELKGEAASGQGVRP